MKIKKITKFKKNLLSLKIIKTKIYNNLKFFSPIKIEHIKARFKKALQIIHNFHKNNKTILFVGTPLKFNKKLKYVLKNTKHMIIPELLWKNGLIHNTVLNNKTEVNKLLLKLKQVPDLVVILTKTTNMTILNETSKTKILSIYLNPSLINDKSSYKVPGDFKFIQKQVRNNLFYMLLLAILRPKSFIKYNFTYTKNPKLIINKKKG